MDTKNHWLLNPITSQTFFNQVWERKYLPIHRDDSDYFAELLNIEHIETQLSTNNLYFPDVQLVKADSSPAIADYTDAERRVLPHRLLQLHREGATVIFSQANKSFSPLASLCRSVSQWLQMRCQTNVYLSPAGHQGFKSHYDTHDVFILQVSGEKTFRFYESGVQLPFPNSTYDPELNTSGAVIAEVPLKAGDTLYIPRGLVHDAVASETSPSLHITLGVFPIVVRDLLQTMIEVMAESDVNLRRSVHPSLNLRQESLLELTQKQFTEDLFNEALGRVADDFALESDPSCDSMLLSSELSLDTTVSIIRQNLLNINERDGKSTLRMMGQVLGFEEPMSSAVQYLCNQGSMLVRELPGLSDEQQLALCQHLQSANAVKLQN